MITPDVEKLRDTFEFPGMKILHFAFGSDNNNPYLPFCYIPNCLVYTGTHDNDTTLGWYEKVSDYDRKRLLEYVGCISPEGIHWTLIRLALFFGGQPGGNSPAGCAGLRQRLPHEHPRQV